MSELKALRVDVPDDRRTGFEDLHQGGWTDGLPVTPTRAEYVRDMLEFKEGNESVAMVAPAGMVTITEKIAMNAFMAGCRNEDLPVLSLQ